MISNKAVASLLFPPITTFGLIFFFTVFLPSLVTISTGSPLFIDCIDLFTSLNPF